VAALARRELEEVGDIEPAEQEADGRGHQATLLVVDEAGFREQPPAPALSVKERVRPMRRFKATATASTFCRGHALIRNLGRGFSGLAPGAAPRLRLATAWTALALLL
jgi:hypothetical protein